MVLHKFKRVVVVLSNLLIRLSESMPMFRFHFVFKVYLCISLHFDMFSTVPKYWVHHEKSCEWSPRRFLGKWPTSRKIWNYLCFFRDPNNKCLVENELDFFFSKKPWLLPTFLGPTLTKKFWLKLALKSSSSSFKCLHCIPPPSQKSGNAPA